MAALGAAFAVAVSYSFLTLGWHYPSDVLGGFLVAAIWTLLGSPRCSVFALTRRGRAPWRAAGEDPDSAGAGVRRRPRCIGCGVALAALVAVARPHEVVSYARLHTAFVIGAAAIAWSP